MQSLICDKPFNFRIAEAPRPAALPNQVLVRIKRCGVCGTDYHAFQGNQPYFKYPRVFGHELSGEVVALGPGATGFNSGDPVVIVPYLACGECIACRRGKPNCCRKINVLGVHIDGGMQEYLNLPASSLIKVPNLTWDQMALTECLAIGAHAVSRVHMEKGEWALIIGAGPIGLGVLELVRLAGGRVILMDLVPKRLQFAGEKLGVEHLLPPGDGALEALAAITGDDMPTLVFDATGAKASMEQSINYLAFGGRLVFVGHFKGAFTMDDQAFHSRETTLCGSRNATARDFQTVLDALAQGSSDAANYITHRTTLAGFPEVIQDWMQPDSGIIKGMIDLK